MAFKSKTELERLLTEYDYTPTDVAKDRRRWQFLKFSETLIGIGGPVTVKRIPPNPNIQVREATPLEYAYLYENNMPQNAGSNAPSAYGHLIQKVPKGQAGKSGKESKEGDKEK